MVLAAEGPLRGRGRADHAHHLLRLRRGGDLISTATPAGNTSSYAYDTLNRLRRQVLPHGGGIDIVTSYAYDTLGRKTHTYEGGTDPDAARYTYDGLSHLRQVEQWTEHWTGVEMPYTEPPADKKATTTYEVDLTGNLISQTDARESTTSYAYNACGWATGKTDPLGNSESFAYTDYGEAWTHTYDGFGRLVSYSDGSDSVSLSYDPMGRLYERKKNETTEVAFRYDGTSLSQSQVTDENGNSLSTYALSPSGTHLAQKNGSTLSYLGLNPHTDVSFTLSGQGALTGARVYDPYGNLLGGSLDSSLGYQEDYEDPLSGLVWMGARWYSPELTRFLSVDPLKGEMDDPLSL